LIRFQTFIYKYARTTLKCLSVKLNSRALPFGAENPIFLRFLNVFNPSWGEKWSWGLFLVPLWSPYSLTSYLSIEIVLIFQTIFSLIDRMRLQNLAYLFLIYRWGMIMAVFPSASCKWIFWRFQLWQYLLERICLSGHVRFFTGNSIILWLCLGYVFTSKFFRIK